MSAFSFHGMLAYFILHKNHIGFYPLPLSIELFLDEISKYKTGKGAIRFPLNEPLPVNLVRQVGLFRAEENVKNATNKTMNIEELREYCLSCKEATEDMPFKDKYLIFRIFGKWFAVIPLQDPELKICLKCNPEKAVDLREKYHCVEAAWHFNKKYWNTITLNQDMNDETVKHWIDHSIEERVKKLPKKIQTEYWAY